ncbi:hypothetical protein ACEV76_24900, partial [Vibrio parahaemolyticus]
NLQSGIFNLASIFVVTKQPNILPSHDILKSPIEYLKGVGPLRGDMLRKELEIFSFNDLLHHFPIRHIDKTQVQPISDIHAGTDFIQVRGKLMQMDILGEKRGKRLVAHIKDQTGSLELTWFQGIHWIQKNL